MEAAVAAAVVVAAQPLALEAGAFVEADRRFVLGPDLEFDLVDVGRAGPDRRVDQHPTASLAAVLGEDPHADRPDAFDAGGTEVDEADQRAALVVFGTLEAVGALPGDASLALTLIPAAIAALIIAAIIVLPRALPQIDGTRGGKIRHGAAAAQTWLREAVDTSVELVSSREMLLVLGAIGYYGFDVASMGAAFEALGGGGPELGLFVLAYTIGHGGAIIPLPGSAEGGLVGAFTLFGSPLSLAVGGILLYRVFHAGVPFLLGALVHRSEFEHPKRTTLETDTFLAEEYWPGRIELDEYGEDCKKR